MIWNSTAEFFAMGGYGGYVWGSYGVIVLALLVDALSARSRHGKARAAAARSGENNGFGQRSP